MTKVMTKRLLTQHLSTIIIKPVTLNCPCPVNLASSIRPVASRLAEPRYIIILCLGST